MVSIIQEFSQCFCAPQIPSLSFSTRKFASQQWDGKDKDTGVDRAAGNVVTTL